MEQLPPYLISNWTLWYGKSQMESLRKQLMDRRDGAIEHWNLSKMTPIGQGLASYVLGGYSPQGPVILKLTPHVQPSHLDEARQESAALTHWSSTGHTPRIYGQRDGGLTLLMERIENYTLVDQLAPAFHVALLAAAARTISHVPLEDSHEIFCHISQSHRLGEWREVISQREPSLLPLLEELVRPTASDVLLHQDLHSANILVTDSSYHIIDPKPLIGPASAEIFGLLTNRTLDILEAQLEQTIEAYSVLAGLDSHRVSQWLAIRSLTTANWAKIGEPKWGLRLMEIHQRLLSILMEKKLL